MSLVAKKKSSYKVAPGVYDGYLVGVYDLGTQVSEKFNNESHKVLLLWELVDETRTVPQTISKFYTLTLNEKGKLRSDIETLLGRNLRPEEDSGFDIGGLLGRGARLQIIEDNDRSVIKSMMGFPPTEKPVPLKSPLVSFDMSAGEPIPEDTPEFVEKLIKRSKEFQEGYPPVRKNATDDEWPIGDEPEEITKPEPF